MIANLPAVITVDGPSAAGKGTLCRALSEKLGWHLLDSGVLYRLLALMVEQQKIDQSFPQAIVELAETVTTNFYDANSRINIDKYSELVEKGINSERIGLLASRIAAFPEVRYALLAKQRAFRRFPGLVADGRDMGSVVFPDALVKIFLDASIAKRAGRRAMQLQLRNFNPDFEQVKADMCARDRSDHERPISALKVTDETLFLDSTELSKKEVFDIAIAHIYEKIS